MGGTHTPIVDEDRVIISFLNSSFGAGGGRPSVPGDGQADGRDRLVGDARRQTRRHNLFHADCGRCGWPPSFDRWKRDGGIYAMNARMGERVWDPAKPARGERERRGRWLPGLCRVRRELRFGGDGTRRLHRRPVSGNVTKHTKLWRRMVWKWVTLPRCCTTAGFTWWPIRESSFAWTPRRRRKSAPSGGACGQRLAGLGR